MDAPFAEVWGWSDNCVWVQGPELESSGTAEQALTRSAISPAPLYSRNKNKAQAESGSELPSVPRGLSAHKPQLLEPHLPAARGSHNKLRVPRHSGRPGSLPSATLPSAFARGPLSSGRVGYKPITTQIVTGMYHTSDYGASQEPKLLKTRPEKNESFTRAQRELRAVVGWSTDEAGCLGDSESRITLSTRRQAHCSWV